MNSFCNTVFVIVMQIKLVVVVVKNFSVRFYACLKGFCTLRIMDKCTSCHLFRYGGLNSIHLHALFH